jgi:hypothetical protein
VVQPLVAERPVAQQAEVMRLGDQLREGWAQHTAGTVAGVPVELDTPYQEEGLVGARILVGEESRRRHEGPSASTVEGGHMVVAVVVVAAVECPVGEGTVQRRWGLHQLEEDMLVEMQHESHMLEAQLQKNISMGVLRYLGGVTRTLLFEFHIIC